MEGQIEGSNDDKVSKGINVCDLSTAFELPGGFPRRCDAGPSRQASQKLVGDRRSQWVGRPRSFLSQRLLSHIGVLGLRQSEKDGFEQDWCYNVLTISTASMAVPHKFHALVFLDFCPVDIKQTWPRDDLRVFLYAKASRKRLS